MRLDSSLFDLPKELPLLQKSFEPELVLLSIIFASIGGYIALQTIEKLRYHVKGHTRNLWLLLGSLALGLGIFSMHFTGMIAVRIGTPILYEPILTLFSILPAVLGSFFTLMLITKKSPSFLRLQGAALTLALGIGVMHYSGMMAMETKALMRYDLLWFLLSFVFAHLLASLTLLVHTFKDKLESYLPSKFTQIITGFLMGLTVSGMHYSAMLASHFYAESPKILTGDASYGFLVSAVTFANGFMILLLLGIHKAEKSLTQGQALEETAMASYLDGVSSTAQNITKELDASVQVIQFESLALGQELNSFEGFVMELIPPHQTEFKEAFKKRFARLNLHLVPITQQALELFKINERLAKLNKSRDHEGCCSDPLEVIEHLLTRLRIKHPEMEFSLLQAPYVHLKAPYTQVFEILFHLMSYLCELEFIGKPKITVKIYAEATQVAIHILSETKMPEHPLTTQGQSLSFLPNPEERNSNTRLLLAYRLTKYTGGTLSIHSGAQGNQINLSFPRAEGSLPRQAAS